MTYAQHLAEARAYYALCDRARRAGVDPSLDAADAPATVVELAARADEAEAAARRHDGRQTMSANPHSAARVVA